MYTKNLKRILSLASVLIMLFFCVFYEYNAFAEDTFFAPTGYSYDELEEIASEYDYTNLSDEYAFDMFDLGEGIGTVDGFCVSDAFIYISDHKMSRIHVYDKALNKVYTIRHGAKDELHFDPRGLFSNADGHLFVITDMDNITGIGQVIEYDTAHEYVNETNYCFVINDEHTMASDVLVLEIGSIFFTVKSDIKKDGKIYEIMEDGKIRGIGNDSFGRLCQSVQGDEAIFVNSSYCPMNNEGQRGIPAIYRIKDMQVTNVQKLPPFVRITASEEEKKQVSKILAQSDISVPPNYIDNLAYELNAALGFGDIAKFSDEYYVLVQQTAAILVFDADFSYRRTIPIAIDAEWDMIEKSKRAIDDDYRFYKAWQLDVDSTGDLYMLVSRISQQNRTTEWQLVRGVKKP